MPEHVTGRAGPQHVGMIDMGSAGDHRMNQRQHLATRTGATNAADQFHRGVDQRFQTEPPGQRRDQQQTSIGDQIRVIERHHNPVNIMRYSCH